MFRWVWGVYAQLSLGAKIKQLLAFIQVVTRLAEVHELQLPTQARAVRPTHTRSKRPCIRPLLKPSPIYYAAPQVQQLLDMLDVFNINVGSLGLPLQCIGLGGYEEHLSFTILASTAC